ncbi:MAG: hypothetical protein KDH96_10440 [Candidatus Riesia sp.]|nr:hypothetical protein [Candidatus Riesia sp.]
MAKDKWDGWNQAGGDQYPVHDFSKEPVLQGVLIDIREGVGKNNSTIYAIQKSDGEKVSVWGNAIIDTRLKNKLNYTVGLEYLGKEKSEKSGREYHNFNVFYKEPERNVADEAADETFGE